MAKSRVTHPGSPGPIAGEARGALQPDEFKVAQPMAPARPGS